MVRVGDHLMELEGNLHASLEYSQVTSGKGLEDAYRELRPQLVTYDEEGVEALERAHAFKDPIPYAHLLWAFSASWRSDNWNDQNAFPEDLGKKVADSKRYRTFMSEISFQDFKQIRPMLLEMLLVTLLIPGDLDPEPAKKKGPKRSTKRSKKARTGT